MLREINRFISSLRFDPRTTIPFKYMNAKGSYYLERAREELMHTNFSVVLVIRLLILWHLTRGEGGDDGKNSTTNTGR